MARLTHVDPAGNAHMVDVGEKAVTRRVAVAEGFATVGPEALAAIVERRAAKGDVLATAQLAGHTLKAKAGFEVMDAKADWFAYRTGVIAVDTSATISEFVRNRTLEGSPRTS